MTDVVILGFGPSALFALMACNEMKIQPVIISKEAMRCPYGAFLYHWLPPKFARQIKLVEVPVYRQGIEEEYLRKQWGERLIAESSFSKYSEIYGYNPFDVFHKVTKDCPHNFMTGEVTEEYRSDLLKNTKYVFQTFPEPDIRKTFIQRAVTVTDNDATPFILYSGVPEVAWVRKSVLFGSEYAEYPSVDSLPEKCKYATFMDIDPDIIYRVAKKPENLHYVGRYAQASRKLMAHDAYFRVRGILNGTIQE
jgi:hypothetical protein